MAFDPKDIGKQKTPEVNDTALYLRDTDQRWFSEVENLYPSPSQVWDGEGYMPEQRIRKLANRRRTEQAINRVAARFLRGDR